MRGLPLLRLPLGLALLHEVFLSHVMTSEALQLGEPVIRYLTEIVYRRLRE